ncbi:MAG: CoA-binding protein [Chloroflexi bacterium]|nr:CoA-binding protein [Chloroflexota bacterium]
MADIVERQLKESKTIAVVGLSPKSERDSYRVARYLQEAGYRIIPVNPAVDEVLGEKSYPDLKSVPMSIDMVDVFRRSEQVPPVVDEAIQVGVKFIWMQDGVIHEEAAEKARAAGIPVVMNNCAMREHRRRFGGGDTETQAPSS